MSQESSFLNRFRELYLLPISVKKGTVVNFGEKEVLLEEKDRITFSQGWLPTLSVAVIATTVMSMSIMDLLVA